MLCDDCRQKTFEKAMGFSKCEICGDLIISAYSPPEKICDICSSKYGACKMCGMSAYKQLSLFDDQEVLPILIDTNVIQQAKEKLGERNADMIASIMSIEDYNPSRRVGRCPNPAHDDSTPSCSYNPKTYSFHALVREVAFAFTEEIVVSTKKLGLTLILEDKKE